MSRVAVRLPSWVEPVDDIMVRAGRPVTERKMFTKVYGLRDIPSLAPGELYEDILVEAGRAALAGGTADLVLYGHTMLMAETDLCAEFPDRLRARLGLSGSRFYGLSHINCASVLRCVEYARRYLARPGASPEERVLVLGGDQGSVGDDARVIAGTTVSGDCAAGVIVHNGQSARYRYLGGAGGRDARFHRNIRMTSEENALFAKVCSAQVVETVERAAASAGMTLDQLDWVLPHLNNKMFWRTFSIQSGIARDRICLDLMPETGHSFGADALMAMEHADRVGRLRPGDRCALIAIGQGAYFQAMIIEVLPD
jgi:3-oxoacyl-[acyl-carrier-protein] synthase-3